MRIIRKFILAVILALLLVGFLVSIYSPEVPELNDGDLVFQTSVSEQSAAIIIATQSKYNHVGIIARTPKGLMVIETSDKEVVEVPFEEWKSRGILNRFAIYRYRDIDEANARLISEQARKYLGRGYDRYFSFENKEVYCSELAQLAYSGVGFDIGKVQRLSELDTDNPLVMSIVKNRWQGDPECKREKAKYETCLGLLREKKLITPASLAADLNLQLIYSNYLF